MIQARLDLGSQSKKLPNINVCIENFTEKFAYVCFKDDSSKIIQGFPLKNAVQKWSCTMKNYLASHVSFEIPPDVHMSLRLYNLSRFKFILHMGN